MTTVTFLTLVVGVAALRVAATSQSELSAPDDEPIASLEQAGARRVETPEVVLQLKYDKGELNKIYLAQFRKPSSPRPAWLPSVSARTSLCADLCHAGLGGDSCGSSCAAMLPVGLKTVLYHDTEQLVVADVSSLDAHSGTPRHAVCPTLCDNQLGEPLCNCSAGVAESATTSVDEHRTDWSAVCAAFCYTDNYVLTGCPSCEESSTWSALSATRAASSRVLATTEGWRAWCGVQCTNGHGGAACNCDRSPLQ